MKNFTIITLSLLICYSCHTSQDIISADNEEMDVKETYIPLLRSDCYNKCDTCYSIKYDADWSDTLRNSWASKVKFPGNTVTVINKSNATTYAFNGGIDTPDYRSRNNTISQESVVTIEGDTMYMFGNNYIIEGDTLCPIRYGQYIYIKEKK